jgi:hypothetical protein
MSIDSNTHRMKSSLTLPGAALYFTEFHADPQNYVVLACENGIIQIFMPSRNNVVATFDIEKAIIEEIKENGNLEADDIDNLDKQVGDVIEVVKTLDVNKTNEYMVLAKEGLFFVTIKQTKKSLSDVVKFEFELLHEDKYFEKNCVKGAFEYDSGKIIALVNGSKSIRFINRTYSREEANLKIGNLSEDSEYRSLRPFPQYNYTTFPYVLIKDSKSLNVINVRSMQSRVIVKNSRFNWDVIRTSMMDLQDNPAAESVTLYNLELDSRLVNESTRVREHTSTIKKFTIHR